MPRRKDIRRKAKETLIGAKNLIRSRLSNNQNFFKGLLVIIATAYFFTGSTFVQGDIFSGVYQALALGLFVVAIVYLIIHFSRVFTNKKIFMNFALMMLAGYLFVFSSWLVNLSYSMQQNYQALYKEYEFRIEPTNINIALYNVANFFDFSSSQGNMTFDLNANDLRGQTITIRFPIDLTIPCPSSIEIYGNTNVHQENFTCIEIAKNIIQMQNFQPISQSGVVRFKFNYTGTIYPLGKFTFSSDVNKVWNLPYTNPNQQPTMIFALKGYSCDNPCYNSLQNSGIDKEGDTMKISTTPEYYNSKSQIFLQQFTLNMLNTHLSFLQNVYQAIGTGLLISTVILFAEYFFKTIYFE